MDDPFRRARDNAGLGPDVTPHTLRHTCATWKVQAGMPLWDVAGFLGMTTKMVDDVYGHHAPERLRKVANA
jgi:integrase